MEHILKSVLKTVFLDNAPYYYLVLSGVIAFQVVVLRSKLKFLSFHETADLMNKASWKTNVFLTLPIIACGLGSIKILMLLSKTQNVTLLYCCLAYQFFVAAVFLYILKSRPFNGRYLYFLLIVVTMMSCLAGFTILPFKDGVLALMIASIFLIPAIYGMGCTIFLNTKSEEIYKDKSG